MGVQTGTLSFSGLRIDLDGVTTSTCIDDLYYNQQVLIDNISIVDENEENLLKYTYYS